MRTALITGTNRGLGLEFARQYLADGWAVVATCRNPDGAGELARLGRKHAELAVEALDLSDFDSIDELGRRLGNRPIDVLINNAGVFGPKILADDDPRQTFGHIDYAIWESILKVNTLAPIRLAEVLLANVRASGEKKLVTISSQVASIAEGGTGIYAYRTSKTAVNMAMATLARELADEPVIVALFNPGWVRTDMGGPDAVLEGTDSVRRMRSLIDGLTKADSGQFIDYDGRRIPW